MYMERISFLAEAIHVIHSMLTPQPSPPRKYPPRLGHEGLGALGRTGEGRGLLLQSNRGYLECTL